MATGVPTNAGAEMKPKPSILEQIIREHVEKLVEMRLKEILSDYSKLQEMLDNDACRLVFESMLRNTTKS